MVQAIEAFYLKQEEPNQSCLLALRRLILQQDSMVSESLKWGMPCFLYKNRMFCFLALDKKKQSPYLLLVEGHAMDHPLLEQGNRKRMKRLSIESTKDIPLALIQCLLNAALDFYRSGQLKSK